MIILVVFSLRQYHNKSNPRWSLTKNVRDYIITSLVFSCGLFAYEECIINEKKFSIIKTMEAGLGSIKFIVLTFLFFLPVSRLVESTVWSLINFVGITQRAFQTWLFLDALVKESINQDDILQ